MNSVKEKADSEFKSFYYLGRKELDRNKSKQDNWDRNISVLQIPYRKNSKNWDTLNYYRDCPSNVIVGFYSAILHSKDADRITNRVDTDQTAPRGAV